MPTKPSLPISDSTFFRSYQDWWVHVLAVLLITTFLGSIVLMLWSAVELWQGALFAGALLLLAISVIDKIYFTVYELNEDGLIVHTQLRAVAVAYRDMSEIIPTRFRALITRRKHKRLALSTHNLTIKIRNNLWSSISVSPEPQDIFLDQLLAKIDRERSRRATVSRKK